MDRERKVAADPAKPLVAPVAGAVPLTAVRQSTAWRAAAGESVRVAGGLMALLLAVLWAVTGALPAVGQVLRDLPPEDQNLLGRLVLTLNGAALPGQGHLPLPALHYDLGPSLPFVLAFLYVFTARGLFDGDSWARTGGVLLAGAGTWLCASYVVNPEAGRLGIALCAGMFLAAIVGRFAHPKVPLGRTASLERAAW
jgi:hypothetical protein